MAATLLLQAVEDIDTAYDTTHGFAETVTGSVVGAAIGIFDDEYYEADPGAEVGVMSSTPMLRTRTADAQNPTTTWVIRTVTYYVADRRDDGYGETIHILRAVL